MVWEGPRRRKATSCTSRKRFTCNARPDDRQAVSSDPCVALTTGFARGAPRRILRPGLAAPGLRLPGKTFPVGPLAWCTREATGEYICLMGLTAILFPGQGS